MYCFTVAYRLNTALRPNSAKLVSSKGYYSQIKKPNRRISCLMNPPIPIWYIVIY